MRQAVESSRAPAGLTEFVVLKSYDGGRHWERERWCPNFSTAADIAQALRSQHPSIRFRVDVEPANGRRRRRSNLPAVAGGRSREIGSP